MAAELLLDFGVVVVVVGVVVVVVGVVVAVVADEDDAVEAGSVVVVVAGAAVVAVVAVDEPESLVRVATVDEWAVVPEATSTPSPTAPADAATAIPVVARRTLLMARSRDRAA